MVPLAIGLENATMAVLVEFSFLADGTIDYIRERCGDSPRGLATMDS